MHSTLILVAGLLATAIFLVPPLVYRHERREGRPHKDALRDFAAFQAVLVGSAVFDYVAVVAQYS